MSKELNDPDHFEEKSRAELEDKDEELSDLIAAEKERLDVVAARGPGLLQGSLVTAVTSAVSCMSLGMTWLVQEILHNKALTYERFQSDLEGVMLLTALAAAVALAVGMIAFYALSHRKVAKSRGELEKYRKARRAVRAELRRCAPQ